MPGEILEHCLPQIDLTIQAAMGYNLISQLDGGDTRTDPMDMSRREGCPEEKAFRKDLQSRSYEKWPTADVA